MVEQTLQELLEDKVELDVEGIDRLYLNAYQSRLQTGGGAVSFVKEDRALRTETTTNNTRDFALGRRLNNLPALRVTGFAANRRVLDVEKISQDCQLGEETFDGVSRPRVVDGQRTSALGFGDPRAMALLQALCLFVPLRQGFRNATLRLRGAQLMGEPHER